MRHLLFWCVFSVLGIKNNGAWDADDLSLFDVVEDVNQNFYELLEIGQSASSTEIRRAYRRVSLQLHPDKNKDPDAENQFRKLVAAYEVLKDDKMRAKYDEILITGLPDWRQPVYYYRKVHKMGLIETSILLSIILTIGHFLVCWSIYAEKMFFLDSRIRKKRDKKSRKQKSEEQEKEASAALEAEQLVPKPKVSDLLPVLIAKGLFHLLARTPDFYRHVVDSAKSWSQKGGEDNDEEDGDDDDPARLRPRKPRPVNNFTYEVAEMPTFKRNDCSHVDHEAAKSEIVGLTDMSLPKSGDWTEAEIEMLVKAIVKFPGGISERWEKISLMVGRSVKEVTSMSKRLKTNNMSELNAKVVTKRNVDTFLKNVDLTTADIDVTPSVAPSKFQKPPVSVTNLRYIEKAPMIPKLLQNPEVQLPISSNPVSSWTQQQQKLLEAAMVKITKEVPDRWDRIAELVPEKTKEECLQRFKYLAELVKKKKTTQQETNTTSAMTCRVDKF